MSDKSFGDHMSRGIVKNPLLSSAVTGLSIEDLTQNAVLLPVSRTQELFGKQEQSGPQSHTLAHPENFAPNIPSGDANFAPIHPSIPEHDPLQYITQQNAKNSKNIENLIANVSNTPSKSEDDFDVNEYFARLQGTRYVSAPLNSHLKDDANTNLEEKEQNLEEINLNEPEKGPMYPDDVQQSLTADIAQNFSQLPTVLPQVASAVFSSFSNMLSMKSREHTPDEMKPHRQVDTPDTSVPLMGVNEVKEVALPPKEPVTGSGNFRITTKKKAYAQIPGLSSGEMTQIPTYTPPNINPPYFTPSNIQTNIQTSFPNTESNQPDAASNVFSAMQNIPVERNDNKPYAFEVPNEDKTNSQAPTQYAPQEFAPQASIIPPPPMFSNLAKRDSLPGAGKSVLPPSVARRISSNKPTISNQAPNFTNFDNIFVPAPITTETLETLLPMPSQSSNAPPLLTQMIQPLPTSSLPSQGLPSQQCFTPASFATTPKPPMSSLSTGNLPPSNTVITSTLAPGNVAPDVSRVSAVNLPPPPPTNTSFTSLNISTAIPTPPVVSSVLLSKLPPPIFTPGSQSELSPSAFTSGKPSQVPANIPAHASATVPPAVPGMQSAIVAPQIFNPYSQDSIAPAPTSQSFAVQNIQSQLPDTSNVPRPFNPFDQISSVSKSEPNAQISSQVFPTPPTETKMPEPPKALGSINFRMTKKRPQYYSGSIEGVGAISNNVKPTLTPVGTDAFQGAFFAPETNSPGYQGSLFAPEAMTDNATTSAFQTATFTPSTITGNQNASEASAGYHGAVFTPETIETSSSTSLHAFDINKQEHAAPSLFDINKSPEYAYSQNYNTAFDMSRQTTDSYEPPKESAFGIIGSLKSKLSSIDINKIQNSVTTFFDPGYNVKPEPTKEYDASSYGQPQSGIEIFVPNIEGTYAQPYNYDAHQTNFTYGLGAIPNPTDYYQQQVHNVYSSNSYYSQPNHGTHTYGQDFQGQQIYNQTTTFDSTVSAPGLPDGVEHKSDLTTYEPALTGCVQGDTVRHQDDNNSVPTQTYEQPERVLKTPDTGLDKSILSGVTQGQFKEIVTDNPKEEEVRQIMDDLHIKNEPETAMEQVKLIASHDTLDKSTSRNIYGIVDMTSPSISESGDLDSNKAFSDMPTKKEDKENQDKMREKRLSTAGFFSSPLMDLSSIIASKTQHQSNEKVNEAGDEMSWNSNEDEFDTQSMAANLKSLAEDESFSENNQPRDLSICETRREVTKPEDKGIDLTSQLIENITSPIQLLNPVEVPLTDSDSTVPVDFSTYDNQYAEISLIADETIETLQVQSATELLDEVEDIKTEINYGWNTEPAFPPTESALDHDYSFKPDSNAVGFFGTNSLFFDNIPNNASDELKAEFKVSKEEIPVVLQSQMSIPTAPPAEDSDDGKSEGTGGLDVLSIEQDANKDFPFEEYVIEPSDFDQTDDDKIEFRDKSDEVKDTFTNRVDRFKKLASSEDLTEHKDSSTANSSVIMPSYFDTGNYAVETHYKNSLTSPTSTTKSSESNGPFRIPPGFEDLDVKSPKPDKDLVPKIPDCTTQTPVTSTLTFSEVRLMSTTTTTVAKIPIFVPEIEPETKLPDFASVFGSKNYTDETPLSISGVKNTEGEISSVKPTRNPKENVNEKITQEKKLNPLPDPINFFASSTQGLDVSEGENRLASYFASAPKTEHTKSFFELSQGQDHYRQHSDKMDDRKSFFELGRSEGHKENISNIPHDKFMANLNLIKDLTSCQNIEPNKEQVVNTVNYFTVEYEDVNVNFNKGEPSVKEYNKKQEIEVSKEKTEINETFIEKEETLIEIVNKCKFCCDLKAGPILSLREINLENLGKASFRQCMDGGSGTAKEEVNMQQERDGEKSNNVKMDDLTPDGDNNEGVAMINENRTTTEYEPVKHHWFYRADNDGKSTWRGFSVSDSRAIENAYLSPDLNENTLVPTDGGRFDVNVLGRLRFSVYWTEKPTNVRRCSWFYKGTTDARYVPYTEPVAEKLEEEYRHGITTGEWHRRLSLPNNELVVMHGPAVMVHFFQGGAADAFSAPNLFTFGKRVYRDLPNFKLPNDVPDKVDHLLLLVHGAGEWKNQKEKIQATMRPRGVRRGFDESEIEDMEPSSIDHLLLLCHGVGSACDMRWRAVEQVVDDFRATSLQLIQSHYRNSCDAGVVGRVEVLPISWHAPLHTGPSGVDKRLSRVTLSSIPRLRNFTNDTVLDVLFYTSPHYCQMILDTVCGELNRVYTLFKSRNPNFKGGVSLGGHSLGSVILYDLLCNQEPSKEPARKIEKQYLSGTAANNPIMKYPKLSFEPLALYALGSPIDLPAGSKHHVCSLHFLHTASIFECIRGVESLGMDFCLPTCPKFFNIFHPYDPIAYRIEPLMNPLLQNVKPSLIPHHKGRKRMHLELKDTMARVGADLKQKLMESIRSTWSSMWASTPPNEHQLEKVVEEEIEKEQLDEESPKEEVMQSDVATGDMLGRLNDGRRVDYVLQEAPFEMINEYIFAMRSHVCYWESEDTMLLILREIYDSLGVQADVTVPQQSMTVQRVQTVRIEEKPNIVNILEDPSTSRQMS